MSYSSEVLTDSPLLYWRLGESAGPTAADASGNGRTGTYGSTVTPGAASLLTGDADTSATFAPGAAANNNVLSTYNPFANTTQRTFTGWLTWDGAGTLPFGVWSGGGSNPPFMQIETSGGDVTFDSQDGAGAGRVTWAAAMPSAGTVYFWALTFDESTDTAELFVNASSQGTKSVTDAYNATPGDFRIGSYASTFNPYKGIQDEVAIFGSILSSARILAHYTAGISVPMDPTAAYVRDFTEHTIGPF